MIKLYTTDCPCCQVLEKKLQQANIDFELVKEFNITDMRERGFMSAPILEVDNNFMDFKTANTWLNERGK